MPKFYEIWMINIFTINQELCFNKKKKKKKKPIMTEMGYVFIHFLFYFLRKFRFRIFSQFLFKK